MADFSQFREGGPQGSPVTPQQPVVDTSTLTQLQTVNSALSLGVSLFTGMEKKEASARIEGAKRNLVSELVSITDSQDMGDIDQRTAQANIRRKYNQALAENTIPTSDLRTIFGDFIDIGSSVKGGTAQEKEQARIRQSAVDAGWVKPSMNQKEAQAAISQYQDFQLAGDKLKRAQEQQSYDKTQRVSTQQAALSEMNIAYTHKARSDIQDTINSLRSGTINQEQAVMDLKNQWANIQSVVTSQGTDAGQAYINNMIAPMKTMYDNALEVADGKLSLQVAQNQADKSIALARANILGDPKTAKIAAFSSLFKNSDLLLIKEIGNKVLEVVGKNSDIAQRPADLTDPSNRGTTDDYLKITSQAIRSVNNGSAVDMKNTEEDIGKNLIQVIKGVGKYGINVDNPSELNSVVSFLADPNTGAYLASRGGVPADVANEAKLVFDQEYRTPAVQAILREFDNGRVKGISSNYLGFGPISDNPVAGSIVPTFTGSGITFSMSPAVKGVDQIAVRARVKQLNKEAAPVLNKLIRLDTHLNGSTNYAKTYKEHYEEMFLPKSSSQNEQKEEKRITNPAAETEPTSILERTLPKEQYAKIEELKNQGFSKDQIVKTLDMLDIRNNRGVGVDIYKAIDEIYKG